MKSILIKIIINVFIKDNKIDLVNYGSSYGGWFIDPKELNNNSNVISAGLGEDASFDIELVNTFGSKVNIFDPTPKAIKHINEIKSNLGIKKKLQYSDHGKQNIKSYDLANLIFDKNIFFHKYALSSKNSDKYLMYLPSKPHYSSYSHYKNITKNSNFIEVKSISLDTFLKKNNIKNIDLIKLDIEGEELSVLGDILKLGINPKQICVEFDSLKHFNIFNYLKFTYLIYQLNLSNYIVIFKNFSSLTFTFKKN